MFPKANKSRSPLKATPLRLPGQSVDEARLALVEEMYEMPAIVSIAFLMVAFLEWADYFFKIPPKPVLWSVVAGGSVAFTAWRFFRMYPGLKRFVRRLTASEPSASSSSHCGSAGTTCITI